MISKKLLINTLCEFGPILSFIIAFEISGFRAGTIAMMVSVILAFITLKQIENHVPIFALLSTATVVLFGGMSLFVNIPSIFILRDTIFDGIFGVVLLISVSMNKPLFKLLFKNVFAITQKGWNTLSLRWGIFFLLLSAINEWIRNMLSPEMWVDAKIIMIIATLIFGTLQLFMVRKHRLPEATPWGIVK